MLTAQAAQAGSGIISGTGGVGGGVSATGVGVGVGVGVGIAGGEEGNVSVRGMQELSRSRSFKMDLRPIFDFEPIDLDVPWKVRQEIRQGNTSTKELWQQREPIPEDKEFNCDGLSHEVKRVDLLTDLPGNGHALVARSGSKEQLSPGRSTDLLRKKSARDNNNNSARISLIARFDALYSDAVASARSGFQEGAAVGTGKTGTDQKEYPEEKEIDQPIDNGLRFLCQDGVMKN
jgi:hypothetical protein